jgi:hypothetical protein
MPRLLLLFFFLTPVLLQAQDITGIWQGHFRSGQGESEHSFSLDDRYRFEVQIAQRGKTFQAVTYSYLSTFFYGKAAARGTVNVRTQKVLLQEGKILEVRNDGDGICIMTCFLQYTKSGGEEFLEGRYVSMNLHDSSNCGRGTVFLRKVQTSQFYPEAFLVKRQQEIEDSLRMVAKNPAPERSTAKTGPPAKPAIAAPHSTTHAAPHSTTRATTHAAPRGTQGSGTQPAAHRTGHHTQRADANGRR